MRLDIDKDLFIKIMEMGDIEQRYKVINENREHLKRWLGWLDSIQKVEDIIEYTKYCIDDFENKSSYNFAIYFKNEFVGAISLKDIDYRNKEVEIGYWLSKTATGSGIITKSCKALIEFVFNELDLNRIIILTATENFESQGIPKRLGFTLEGTLRENEYLYGKYVDNYLYSMIKKDWK